MRFGGSSSRRDACGGGGGPGLGDGRPPRGPAPAGGSRAPHRVLRLLRGLSRLRGVSREVRPMRRARAAFVGRGGAVLLCPLLSWLCAAGGDLAAAAPAGGEASGTPSNVQADQVSVDSRGATLLAAGHVSVTYGALRGTRASLRLNRSHGTSVFQGHLAVTDPHAPA